MIREAVRSDLPALLVLGAKAYEESPFKRIIEQDDYDTYRMLSNMIESNQQAILVAESGREIVGMLGFVIVPSFWNNAHKMAQDLFWYVAPEHRGTAGLKLLKQYEQTAKDMGAHSLMMVCVKKTKSDKMRKVFKRNGLRELDQKWIKEL